MYQNFFKYSIGITSGFLLFLLFLMLVPIDSTMASNSNPARNYNSALRKLDRLKLKDTDEIDEVCKTRDYLQEQATQKIIVLLHGLSNCPYQHRDLAQQYFDKGYNVIVPRIPGNGFKDKTGTALLDVSLENLSGFVDEVVDIADGLGEQVILIGLSAGANLALWAGQVREEVDQVVAISPFLEMANVPIFASQMAMNLFQRIPNLPPNRFTKFNKRPDYVYFGHQTKGLSKFMLFAEEIQRSSKNEAPKTSKIRFISIEEDDSINNQATRTLIENYKNKGFNNIDAYEFSADLEIPHDSIDPGHLDQKTKEVYPTLLDLV